MRSFLCLLLLIFCSAPIWAENWKFFGGNTYVHLYVDLDTLNRKSAEVAEVQVKCVFTPEGRENFRKNAKSNPSYSRETIELTRSGHQRSLKMSLYTEQDELIYTREVPKGSEPIELRTPVGVLWQFIYRENTD